MQLTSITSAGELGALVEEIGLLPFFRCGIPGFSLEECTPAEYWFVDGVEGPWQWREQLAAGGSIAYAKLFRGKTGFVGMQWYPDLCNYRRDGYDFDARYEDGLANHKCKRIMDVMIAQEPRLSTELKHQAGFGKDGAKGFDSAMTALQMQTYLTVKEFVYKRDLHGKPYGWGVGRYALPEELYGEAVTAAYHREPGHSKARLVEQLARICPNAAQQDLLKLIH